jgi:Tol biopolymer transport system component
MFNSWSKRMSQVQARSVLTFFVISGSAITSWAEIDQTWQAARPYFPGVFSTPNMEYGVTFSPDGEYLQFITSNMPGGYGSCDIYGSHKLPTGWGEPVNLGPNVNTETCELTPSVSPDGNTLFFGRALGPDTANDDRDIYSVSLANTKLSKN